MSPPLLLGNALNGLHLIFYERSPTIWLSSYPSKSIQGIEPLGNFPVSDVEFASLKMMFVSVTLFFADSTSLVPH
jgi:hypothetical protein